MKRLHERPIEDMDTDMDATDEIEVDII